MSRVENSVREKVGDLYESGFCFEIKEYFIRNKRLTRGKNDPRLLQVHHKDEMDICEGTDAVIEGVRVDFTVNFSEKDHIDKTVKFKSIRTMYGAIEFAIRLGNNHNGGTTFSEPVLVVGMDVPPQYAMSRYDAIMECFKGKVAEVVESISDYYYEYCDSHDIDIA